MLLYEYYDFIKCTFQNEYYDSIRIMILMAI